MSTDFQAARIALGARMRELRVEAGLNGRGIAARLGWQASKVSRLENGKQTPGARDLAEWAQAVGRPDTLPELKGRLRGMETRYRTWRRQLAAGHLPRQEAGIAETQRTRVVRGFEASVIPGMFQTADYARGVLSRYADFRTTPRDTEAAVNARIRRQEALYRPGREFRMLVWEGAFYVLLCPREVLAAQLDRLISLLGLANVSLGVVPFGAPLTIAPGDGFSIYDERLVVSETWNLEMWLEESDDIAFFSKVWAAMDEAAVYGHRAHRLIARARAALDHA
ncbi:MULTISPECIES: helix-turn-helix domain-containing protein [Streptomyces]|uniref:Transcriptional regulator n=1 Tax=Streptomyces cacaoi TaxID=1898 RepID=A0A4Y3R282_STRCI|nr:MULTISPECIES: helix-turn-helix transcriptional regulator [Streptomyces]NNG85967.1 helix-turn-helix transcriptional regulator [Streptomyces cacaoi]GEB51027.1 transcriptional regulator [Streptomyces cacaoi]